MALINSSVFLGVADKMGKQYSMIAADYTGIGATGTGSYYSRLTATEDSDVELTTLSGALSLDDTPPTIVNAMSGMTTLKNMIAAMDSHFSRVSQTGSWGGYCVGQSVRVSDYTNQVYYAQKRTYMVSNAVFCEDDTTFATFEITSVAPPGAGTFTNGDDYGTGAAVNLANGTNFAPTQLRAYVDTSGGAELKLTLSVKDPDDVATTIDVTIPGGSIPGDWVDIGTSADRFLNVTGIAVKTGGTYGTVGDIIEIHNLKERVVVL